MFSADGTRAAKKAWLAGRLTSKGRIHIDAGAAKALARGASLLPAGAKAIDGAFRRGDVVEIVDAEGHVLAHGLAEYDAPDATRICGLRTEALADVLGYAPRAVLVHRDHMVLL